jgi:hypothetical protein
MFLEDDKRSNRRSAAAELAHFWHHTQQTRDVLMEGDECLQRLTASALMEQIVIKVTALTFDAVLSYEHERNPKSVLRCKGEQDREKPVILIGQKGFRMGELIGNNVVLQTLQAHGGLYDGFYSRIFSKLSAQEELWRYAELPTAPGEGLLQQYLWKLKQQDPTTFALRVGVKGDGKPRNIISRANLQPMGYLFGRVLKFPCRCLEVGPIFLEEATEFEQTEAWQLLLQHAFDAGVQRVELLVDTAASSTCVQLLRVGFVFEATHAQFHMNEHHINSAVCFAIRAADREQVAALQSRRLTNLVKNDNNQCLFPAHSRVLEFEVAFKNAAIGIDLSAEPPIFVQSIHATKGVGLPATLTQAAHAEKGPYLVTVQGRDASGLTRKQVLELLRNLPRPVILTFRMRAQRPQVPVLADADGCYKTVLGVRMTMLSEMFKRDHPEQYRKTKGGFQQRADRQANEIQSPSQGVIQQCI